MTASDRNLRLDYIEFTVADIAASKAFYGAAFGWTFTDYGPDYCEFDDGRMKGGFNTHGAPRPGGALIVLYADDLAQAQDRVEAAGAKVVASHEFPGGRRFHFIDPDGYELAVWSDR
ncbi:VOC family protein [Lysobacter sp. CA196]|uniref:VOC family protein n=1 Tax=Lysobacter sp. CA196 TaxID=3455606 RepID=UPI003F8D7B87